MTDHETASVQGEGRCTNPYCHDGWVERGDNESGGAPRFPCKVCRKALPPVPAPSDEAVERRAAIERVARDGAFKASRGVSTREGELWDEAWRAAREFYTDRYGADLPRLLAEARAEGETARTAEIVAWLREESNAQHGQTILQRLGEAARSREKWAWFNRAADAVATHFNPEAE